MTDLSIIIPAHNEAGTISEQLDALAAQEWNGSWDVIVVDNQSTDATRSIVESYSQSVDVRVVTAPKQLGINYARNVGVASTTATAMAFCDADDVVATGWVAQMGSALLRHELVTGALELDRLNPAWLADSRGRGDEHRCPTFYGIFPTAHGNNLGIRREAFSRIGGFDEEVLFGADDVELSLRAWLDGIELVYLADAVVHYRYRSSAAQLWRQGRKYGRGRPFIRQRLGSLGLPTPSPIAGWRSWAWLFRHMTDVHTPEGRAVWTWVAGNRWGQIEGSIKYRSLLI